MARSPRLGPLALVGMMACAPISATIGPEQAAPAPEIVAPELEPEEQTPATCGPSVLAVIGAEALAMTDFEELFALKSRKYDDRGRTMPATAELRYRNSLSERLIYQRILELETARLQLDYDPQELAEREQITRLGLTDFEAHLRRRGESEASLRAIYIGELRERALLEAEGVLEPSPAEIQAEYDELALNYDQKVDRVRASHILIEIDPERPERATRAKAKTEAERILAEARKPNTDFAALARLESTGPSTGRGGDLGIFSADRMVEDFSKPVFKAKAGDILMTETKFGFHVVWVVGHYGPGRLPLSALEDLIRERLAARKLHTGRVELKDELLARYEPRNCERERVEATPPPTEPRTSGEFR